MSTVNRKKMLTPCIGKCTTSTGDKICKGCGRTELQIRDWNTYSDEQKLEIMVKLKTLPKS